MMRAIMTDDRQYERRGIALSLLAQVLLGTDSQHEGAGGGSLPRSHRRDACSSPTMCAAPSR